MEILEQVTLDTPNFVDTFHIISIISNILNGFKKINIITTLEY